MKIEKELEWIRETPTDKLQEILCQVEFERLIATHDNDYQRQNYLELCTDAICGELLKRDKSARNDREPKWDIPLAPATFYQLMALGDGSIR